MGSGASALDPSSFTETDFAAIKAEYEKLKEGGMAEEEIATAMRDMIDSLKKPTEDIPIEHTAPTDAAVSIPSEINDKFLLKLLDADQHVVQSTNKSCIEVCTTVCADMKITDIVPVVASIDSSAVISVASNFDPLLLPAQHMMRHPADSYYLENTEKMLRTNMLCYVVDLVKSSACLCGTISGDVFRRQEEDKYTSEMMNEMTFFVITPKVSGEDGKNVVDYQGFGRSVVTGMLQKTIEGGDFKFRWEEENEDMPFVQDEVVYELQIQHQNAPLGVAVGGAFSEEFLRACGCEGKMGFYVSFSLDRLAMISSTVENISDIQKPAAAQ